MPNEQKYEQFADLVALSKQTDAILEMFGTIEAGIRRLNEFGIKLNSSKSTTETSKLTDEFERQKKVVKTQQDELHKLAQTLKLLQTEDAKRIAGAKEVINLTKQLTAADAKRQLLQQSEYQNAVKAKLANQQLNKEILLRIKLNQARAGSEEKLVLQYQKAQLILSKQAPAQRDSNRGKELQKFAADTKKALDEIQQKVGNFKGNVGNYAKSLADGFDLVTKEIAKLKTQAQGLQDLSARDPVGFKLGGGEIELKKTTAALEDLERVQQIGFKTGQSFNTTVKEISKSVADLGASGKVSKEFMEQFTQFAAQAQRDAANVRNEIKALSSETRGLDLASGALSTLASGFEGVAGVAALTGQETEDVQKSIHKLIAIQSVANSVREIGKQITEKGTIANKAYNFVIQQGTVLFGKGSTAAQRFGAAMKGIVIVAVIGFLIQLIKYLAESGDNAEEAEKRLKGFNDELERNKKISKSLSESAKFDFDSNLESLKRANAEKLKLAKNDDDRRKIETQNAKSEFDLEVQFKEQQIRDLRVIQENANNDEIREAQRQHQYKLVLAKHGVRKISKEEGQALRDLINATENANIEARDNLKNAQRDLVLLKKKNNTELSEQDSEFAQQQNEKSKEAAKQRMQDEFNLFVYRKTLQKEQAEAIANVDEIGNVDLRIAKAKEAAQAETDIIIRTKEFELKQEGVTATKRIHINEKASNDIFDINVALGNKITELRVAEFERRKTDAQTTVDLLREQLQTQIQLEADAQQKRFDLKNAFVAKERSIALQNAAKQADDELKIAGDNVAKRAVVEEAYAERKKQIEFDYQKDVINNTITFYEKQLKDLKDSGEDTLATEAAIEAAKLELIQLGFDERKAVIDKEIALANAVRDNYLETFQQIQDSFVNVLGAIGEKRKLQIDEEIERIDIRKAKEIEAIQASGEADEKKAAKAKLIELKAQHDKEALDRRKKQIDRQRAVFERGFKAFDIITDNITGINKIRLQVAEAPIPLKPLYISQLILAIASGAASLTALFATPLPGYWKGTQHSIEGHARVAEKGAELGVEPSGKTILWKEPTTVKLRGGTKIYPADVTHKIIQSATRDVVHDYIPFEEIHDDKITEKEMLYVLQKIEKKSGIMIRNEYGIETTAWYINNMKR